MKLPPFWTDRPGVWFAQADSQFVISHIVHEETKYHYVISQLDARATAEDIITAPMVPLPYTNLRQKLVERLSSSEEQSVRQLIHDEELGDRRPSQFLRHLKSLAGPNVIQPNLLRQLWLRRMPSHVQAILTSRPELSLDQISELADKIVEVAPVSMPVAVHAIAANQVDNSHNALLTAIETLMQEVRELRTNPESSRNRSRSKSHGSRNRSQSKQGDHKLCWYHRRFQGKAKRCISPCEFKGNEKGNQ